MARRLRLHMPGGFYHVTLRGNHRQPIFFADTDRDLLGLVIADAVDRLEARIHAFCWMTNHLHLLVQVADAPLGRLILRIASRYARRVQASLPTTGHLFERRYHAVLVDADSYLLTLIRYIHLNPVRAAMVSDPANYPWSSHPAYLGKSQPIWLTTSFTQRLLGGTRDQSIERYRRFMNTTEDCRWGEGMLRPRTDQPDILGSDDFVARACAAIGQPRQHKSLDDLIGECAVRFHIPADALASPSRAHHLAAARAWLAHRAVVEGIASVSELARRLGRSESAIRQVMAHHPLSTS